MVEFIASCIGKRLGLLVVSLSPFLAGCGETYPHGSLEGTVTVDGQPLEIGTLHFTPLEGGRGPTASAEVEPDGKYRAERVPLGKVRVVIHAIKETGKMLRDKDMDIDYPETVSLIAPKYHLQGIEIDVASGASVHDFPLTSK